MQSNHSELIIEIDADVELLIKEINASPDTQQQTQFIDAFQNMLVDQLMGPLGLTRAMFDDRDGGAITTEHNFKKGVVANDADLERHQNWEKAQSEKFDRSDYEKPLKAERETEFAEHEEIVDAYTRAKLPKDEDTVRDHIVSAHEIEQSAKGHLGQTRAERVATADQAANKAWTKRNLNASKGDRDFLEWADAPSTKDPSKTNREFFNVDEESMKEHYQRARKAVDKEQSRAVLKKQAGELLVEGGLAAGKLALKQILGLLLKDLVEGLVQDVRYLIREGFNAAKSLAQLAEERIKATYERIRRKWAEYLKDGASAGLSGFLSSFVTLLINSFITTAKNVVRMIREAVLSLARAVKTIVAPPPGMAAGEIASEVVKVLSTAVAACIGIALEEAIHNALMAVPLLMPFAATIAPVIAGIVTGTLTLFTVLAFDRLKGVIAFRNKQLADVHRGQVVGFLKVKQTVLMLDSAYANMRITAEALRAQFASDWHGVQTARAATQKQIGTYRDAVSGLDDVLEMF